MDMYGEPVTEPLLLTKHEYYTGLAMQAIITSKLYTDPEFAAAKAIEYADSVIDALERKATKSQPKKKLPEDLNKAIDERLSENDLQEWLRKHRRDNGLNFEAVE